MADANPEDFKAPSQEDMDKLVAEMQGKGLTKEQAASMLESVLSNIGPAMMETRTAADKEAGHQNRGKKGKDNQIKGESNSISPLMSMFNKSWPNQETSAEPEVILAGEAKDLPPVEDKATLAGEAQDLPMPTQVTGGFDAKPQGSISLASTESPNPTAPEMAVEVPRTVDVSNLSTEFNFPVEAEETEYKFDWSETVNSFVNQKLTESSKLEMSKLVSNKLNMPADAVKESLDSGDTSLIAEMNAQTEQDLGRFMDEAAAKEIAAKNNPQDVLTFLKEFAKGRDIRPTLAEQRAAYVESLVVFGGGNDAPLDFEGVSPILAYTLKNNIIAADIEKQQTEQANSFTYRKAFLDALEIVTPFVGAAEEEWAKYTSEIYTRADELENIPFEKQRELVKVMVEAAIAVETTAFNNNNSFISGAQIDTLYTSILQGGLNDPQGSITAAERGSYLETAFNGTIFVGEAFSIGKSTANAVRFLMRRIHSSKVLKEVVAEEEAFARLVIERQVRMNSNPNVVRENTIFINPELQRPSIVENASDIRGPLTAESAKKGTRKPKKDLESEKKSIAGERSKEQSKNINTEARAFAATQKVKFKDARSTVKANQKSSLQEIDQRAAANQKAIDDFEMAAKAEADLSRIQTKLKDGRVSESSLIKKDGTFNATPYTGFYRSIAQREGANVIDTEFLFNPRAQTRIEQEGGIEAVQQSSGLTPEQVAERYLPTSSSDTDIGMNNIPSPRKLNDLILADDTFANIGMRLGRELEKANGSSLTPTISGTRFTEGTTDTELGTFTFLLQDGARGGFKRLTDAKKAAEKASLGYPYKIVQKENGYYVEMEVEHYTNPFNDAAPLDIKAGTTPSSVVSWALNHARVVEEDIIRGLYALKGTNRSTVQKMEQKAKIAMGLLPKNNTLLMKVLERGDDLEVEWATKKSMEQVFGRVPEQVYQGYRKIREVYDDIYMIRERNYYNRLRAANNKYIKLGDEYEMGIGSVVKQDKIVDDGLVYDTLTKQMISKEKLRPEDVIVELGTPIQVGDDLRTFVRVMPTDVRQLTAGTTMNMRVGHIDRMYRDAGWVVKQTNTRKVNGVDKPNSRVTHVVKTEKEALEIVRAERAAKGLDDTDETILASPSRENDEIDFLKEDSAQMGYGASHLKKRGEQVKGPNGTGTAGILNAFESLFRTVNSMQGALDFNALKTAEVKFFKAFEGVLKKGSATRYDNDPSVMQNADFVKLSPDMRQEFLNHHAYLKTLRYNMLDESLKQADAVFNKLLSPIGTTVRTQNGIAKMTSATSELSIVWNGGYQGAQNTLQALYAISSDPINGAKAVGMYPQLLRMMITGDNTGLAKWTGSAKLADELFEELSNNGLIDAIGRSNDFLDLARTAGATIRTKNIGLVTDVAKGVTAIPALRQISLKAQEYPIILGNTLSYLTEFLTAKGTKGFKFDGRMRAELSFQAQKRMLTQNSLDQFSFQKRGAAISAVGQFLQAVYKAMLDQVVEPQWEVIRGGLNLILKPVFDKELKSMGKNRARVADTYSKAFITASLTYVMFGPEGGMGKGLGSSLEDTVRKQYQTPADVPRALDGFFNGMWSELINLGVTDGKIDVNATFSPSAYLDMVQSLVFGEFGQLNLLGASGFMMANVAESAFSTALLAGGFAFGDLELEETLILIAGELTEPLKILDSTQKAYIGYNTLRNASGKTLSGDDRITQQEAILSVFGFESELVMDKIYHTKFTRPNDGIADMSFYAKKAIDTTLQQYARQLTREIDKGTLTLAKQQELVVKWSNVAKLWTGKEFWNSIDTSYAQRALKATPPSFSGYAKTAIDGKTEEQIVNSLRILTQKADGHSEEAEEVLNNIRESYEIMRVDNNE